MNEELQREIERYKESLSNLGVAIVKAIEPILEKFAHLFDGMEPYQKYELMHPRKKPRGSIRRRRRDCNEM